MMQYKTSFFLMVLGQFLASFSAVAVIYFMMSRFHRVDGYTFNEILLCFAVTSMSFSLSECFARGFDQFPQMLGDGTFDRIMVRPRSVMLQVLGSKVELSRIGRLVQSTIVFAYAIPRSGIVWTWEKSLTLILMMGCGMLIFSGLFIIYAALCFFTTQGLEFMNVLTDGGREFGSYPFSIYGEGVLKFLTFVVPLALFQYYPFLYLIGRSENKFYMILPLISLVFLIPCYLIWRLGIRHYKSTGS